MTNEELLKLKPGYYWVRPDFAWRVAQWCGHYAVLPGLGHPIQGNDLEDWEWNLEPIQPPA